MAWPPHYYVEFGGRRALGSREIWQCGIRVAKIPDDGETVPIGDEPFEAQYDTRDYVLGKVAFVVWTWFTDARTCISPHCRLDWVSAKWITASGNPDPAHSYRHSYEDFCEWIPPGSHPGGGSPGIVHPFQSAVVISWASKLITHGPGSRGRIFSPAPTVQLDGDTGLFSLEQAQGIAENAWYLVLWLAFGNAPTSDKRFPSIVSPAGAGHRARIDYITVDTRVDVLRKRAEWQDPAYGRHELDWGVFADLPPLNDPHWP